jgi:hypothetical protein
LSRHEADEPFAPARDDKIEVVVERQHLLHRGAVGRGHERHGGGIDALGLQRRMQRVGDGVV